MASFAQRRHLSHAVSAPKTVEQITKEAGTYEFNALVPLRFWLRSAAALLKEADIYAREGDEETTYLLLFRHAHLALVHLTAHPEAKQPELQAQLAAIQREVNKNLKTLDILKPKINERYARYNQIVREREARRVATTSLHTSESPAAVEDRRGHVQQLHGYEHSELAVRLAQREIKRRAGTQISGSDSGQSRVEDDDLSKQLQTIRARVEPNQVSPSQEPQARARDSFTSRSTYNYPEVQTHGQNQIPLNNQQYKLSVPRNSEPHLPPERPPKPPRPGELAAPPRPEKIRDVPAVIETTIEPSYTFTTTAALENGTPLRTLFLPPTLRTTFLRIAHKNTLLNLETCAFLAGTLISNALFVSKLIVPAQIATSDTCEMTNESQLFDYVDSVKDLMVLGWIHTHPTQTCFMSSRDLHTHAGYQMMLAESIAIVCAPSKGDTTHGGDWGVYRLTDPPGKMAILNCNKPGIFHPHDVDNVYTDALRPGHVVEAKGLEFEVVDLRDKQ